jgi:predicted dehydrogenase
MRDEVLAPTDGDIRFGVIGSGMMGCEHLRNIEALPGATVVALSDPDERSRADGVDAVEGRDVTVYDDHRAMLERSDLDAVVVATPNFTHRSVLESVWDTELHVMIEKPMCTTVGDCLEVRRRAEEHPGLVWVGLEYRYLPAVDRLVRAVRDGAVGTPVMAAIREHRFPFLVKVGNWNRFNRYTGGTLVEKCCHFFDLMNLVLPGRPTTVMASGGHDVNHLDESYDGERPDMLDNAFVVVEYDSGARALLDLCMFAEGSRFEQEIAVTGVAGKVEALVPGFMEVSRGRRPEFVSGRREDWTAAVDVVGDDDRVRYQGGHHGASYLEHVDFCDAIRSGAPPTVTVDDGLWSVALGAAAQQSIAEHRPVPLPQFG